MNGNDASCFVGHAFHHRFRSEHEVSLAANTQANWRVHRFHPDRASVRRQVTKVINQVAGEGVDAIFASKKGATLRHDTGAVKQ